MLSKIITLVMLILGITNFSYSQIFELDQTFGEEGISYLSISSPPWSYSKHLISTQNDETLITGYGAFTSTVDNVLFSKVDQSGTFLPNFDFNGWLYKTFSGYSERAFKTLQLPNGEFIISGNTYVDDLHSVPTCWKANEDIILDETFGINGFSQPSIFQYGATTDLDLDTEGFYYHTGFFYDTTCTFSVPFIGRYSTNGIIDNSFSAGGIHTFQSSVLLTQSQKLEIDNSGLPVHAIRTKDTFGDKTKLRVTRLNIDGTNDQSFGNFGEFEYEFAENFYTFNFKSMKIDDENRILIAGVNLETNINHSAFILRILATGTLDSSFGNNGIYFFHPSYLEEIFHSECLIGSVTENEIVLIGSQVDQNYQKGIYSLVLDGSGSPNIQNGPDGLQNFSVENFIDLRDVKKISNNKLLILGDYDKNNDDKVDPVLIQLTRIGSSVTYSTPSNNQEIKVFPNPTSGHFTLQAPHDVNNNIEYIQVADQFGKIVFEIQPESNNQQKGYFISNIPAELPVGMYTITAQYKTERHSTVLIIQR